MTKNRGRESRRPSAATYLYDGATYESYGPPRGSQP